MDKLSLGKLIKQATSEKFLIFIDQALFSLFNFGSIFVLSKLASVSVFSDFVVFQSNIFFLYIFCTFFLSGPVLVLYAKKWENDKAAYLKVLFWANIIINTTFSILLYLLIIKQGIDVSFYYVLGIPLTMSMFDLFKKYIFSSSKIKLYHAGVSSILLNSIFFLSVIIFEEDLSLSLILFLYLFSYLVANAYLIFIFTIKSIVGFDFLIPSFLKKDNFLEILKHHYVYSRWIIFGGIAFWGYSQGLYIFSNMLNVSDFGISKIRTIQNLLGIVTIFHITVENFYTPYFSKFIVENSERDLHSLVLKLYKKNYGKVLAILTLVFVFAIVFYQLLYVEKYGDAVFIILLYTLSQLILFMVRPLIISLKSIEVTHPFFIAHLAAVIVMLVFGYFLINKFEYYGIAYTFVASTFIFNCIVIYYYYQKVFKNHIIKN
jgi:O-antigen/teichoic acid export membrane protein